MKKSQIEFHSDRGPSHPAVNVKDRSRYMLPQLMAHFRCCEATAQKAHQFAWDMHAESFWETAQESCDHCLGEGKVYSEGRQAGWAVVHDLPEVETWDAIRVSRWARFAKELRAEVDWLTSFEAIRDSIEANEWAPADALLDDAEEETAERAHWEARDVQTV